MWLVLTLVSGLEACSERLSLDEELNMVDLNCASTVQLAKYVVRHMADRNSGRILFTASIAGEMVAPREAVYAATKAFVLSFAHSVRYELKDTNVSVTALQPGSNRHGLLSPGGYGRHGSRPERKIG